MRMKLVVSVFFVMLLSSTAMAQGRGNAQATIKGNRVAINYGRPALQGRDMLSQAQPGTVWRLGMNEATEIETTGTLIIAGKELKPGKYSLWAKMNGPNAWVLAFHPRTGLWGQPELKSGYIAELPLKLDRIPNPIETLNIALTDKAGDAAVTIQWGTTQLTGTLGVK
jgi:hypothetical protein